MGKQCQTLFWGGSKITADGDCHEIKRCLLLGRKVMTNLDSILKSRDIPLPTKVHLVKAMVFPVVMYECESWTVKKAECQRIDAFERWCWRRLLRVPWTARRSNQSILKEISPGCSLDGCWSWNSNTLATSCEELTHWKRPSCWERLEAGGEGADRGWDGWMASPTWWTWVWVNSRSWWWTGRPGVLRLMGSHRVGHDWVTELNCNTDLSKSYNRVCPRSKSCDVLRALMSVAPNLWCDETELRSIYSPDIYGVRFKLRFNLTETTSAWKRPSIAQLGKSSRGWSGTWRKRREREATRGPLAQWARTVKNELSRKLTWLSLRFQKTSG